MVCSSMGKWKEGSLETTTPHKYSMIFWLRHTEVKWIARHMGQWSHIIRQRSQIIGQWSQMTGQWSHFIGQRSHLTRQWSHMIGQRSHMIGQWCHMIGQWSDFIWINGVTWSDNGITWSDNFNTKWFLPFLKSLAILSQREWKWLQW